eukprot:6181879-Pleurochrysis_carterae.AAC.2
MRTSAQSRVDANARASRARALRICTSVRLYAAPAPTSMAARSGGCPDPKWSVTPSSVASKCESGWPHRIVDGVTAESRAARSC